MGVCICRYKCVKNKSSSVRPKSIMYPLPIELDVLSNHDPNTSSQVLYIKARKKLYSHAIKNFDSFGSVNDFRPIELSLPKRFKRRLFCTHFISLS